MNRAYGTARLSLVHSAFSTLKVSLLTLIGVGIRVHVRSVQTVLIQV